MQTNTNNLFYVIVGAIVILAIFLLFQSQQNDLLEKTFKTADSTIELNNFMKKEIKYECLVFNNVTINKDTRVVTADIKNICYGDISKNLNLDFYSDKDTIGYTTNFSINIISEEERANTILTTLPESLEEIYNLKIKEN